MDTSRFKATEGLVKTELLGVDSPTLPRLIERAVLQCPMNVRREMWQSIYLGGGTTLTDGFAERLQKELGKITPPSINIQVSDLLVISSHFITLTILCRAVCRQQPLRTVKIKPTTHFCL